MTSGRSIHSSTVWSVVWASSHSADWTWIGTAGKAPFWPAWSAWRWQFATAVTSSLPDARRVEHVNDRPTDRVVSRVELRVAEPEPRVEHEHAILVPHGIPHDDPTPPRQLRIGKPKLRQLERHDLDVGHATSSPAAWMGVEGQGGRVEHRSERTGVRVREAQAQAAADEDDAEIERLTTAFYDF